MLSRYFLFGITAISSMLATTAASADATLEVQGPDKLISTVQISNNRGRISSNNSRKYLLYDSNTGIITYVEPQQRQYTQLSAAELETMVQTAANVKQTMAGMLAGLPEAQRKMIEQRMGVLPGTPAAGKPALPATIRIVKQDMDTIAGLHCQNSSILKNDQPAVEACMATAASGKLSEQDFSTLAALVKLSRNMADNASGLLDGTAAQYQLLAAGLEGIPVAVHDLRQDKRIRITTISNDTLTDELFSGYEKFEKQNLQNLFR